MLKRIGEAAFRKAVNLFRRVRGLSWQEQAVLFFSIILLPFSFGLGMFGLLGLAAYHWKFMDRFSRMKQVDKLLVVLLALSPIFLLVIFGLHIFFIIILPLWFVVLGVSIVGLNALMWLGVHRVFMTLLSRLGLRHWVGPVAATLLVMTAIPAIVNARLAGLVDEIQHRDRAYAVTRPPGPVTAIVSRDEDSKCEELCMRLFMGSGAQRVIQANIYRGVDALTNPFAKLDTSSFTRTDKRDCKRMWFGARAPRHSFAGDSFAAVKDELAGLMALSVSAQGCIERRSSNVKDADQMVLLQDWQARRSDHFDLSLNPKGLLKTAKRIGYYRPSEKGFYNFYRATSLTYRKMAPVLLLNLRGGRNVSFGIEFLPGRDIVLEPANGAHMMPVEELLESRLQLKLGVDGQQKKQLQDDAIEGLVSLTRGIGPDDLRLLDAWFEDLSTRELLTTETRNQILKLYRQFALPLPIRATRHVLEAAKDDPAFQRQVVDILMKRFEVMTDRYATAKSYSELTKLDRELLKAADFNLDDVPDDLMKPHLKTLLAVFARRPFGMAHEDWDSRIRYAHRRLASLPDDDLDLIMERRGAMGLPYFQTVMCELGPRAARFLPEVTDILFDQRLSSSDTLTGRTTLQILTRMGAKPDTLWPRYAALEGRRLAMSRERFDRFVARAQRPDSGVCSS